MEEKEKMLIKSVTIKPQHKQYLDEHPDINFSGLVRKCIDEHMKGNETTQNGT